MEVIIAPTATAAANLAAERVARELEAKPDLVLGLATGNTMEAFYERLVQLYHEWHLDFSRCRTFNLDEYVGLGASDPGSYHSYMRKWLFDRVNLDPRNTRLPNGMALDLENECREYEAAIQELGGIDIQLLGIGLNGHLGFNEPLSGFRSRTRVEKLSNMTRKQNAPLFTHPEEVPRQAITMGVGTILEARRCLLLATGEEKSEVVARMIEGPLTAMVTATALQLHPACQVVLDEAAAGALHPNEHFQRGLEAGAALAGRLAVEPEPADTAALLEADGAAKPVGRNRI